jgi:hypothetical protein
MQNFGINNINRFAVAVWRKEHTDIGRIRRSRQSHIQLTVKVLKSMPTFFIVCPCALLIDIAKASCMGNCKRQEVNSWMGLMECAVSTHDTKIK